MRFYWPAVFTLVALFGLGILQWQLLRAAVQLEQHGFDRQVERALWQIDRQIRADRAVRFGLLTLQRYQSRAEAAPDTLQHAVRDKLDSLTSAVLSRNGIRGDHQLDVLTGNVAVSLMPAVASRFSDAGWDYDYIREVRGRLAETCDCQLYLRLGIRGMSFPQLFSRLWWLLVPAILFFLLLILGFVLLWRGINREQKLSQAKNDFINHLTHEMKTPVFSISLLSTLLRRQLDTGQGDATREYLDRMDAQTKQLKGQVEQILELASLEQPAYQLQLEQVDLASMIQDWAAPFAQQLAENRGKLYMDTLTPVKLRVDTAHLRNAVQNILDNAVKYGGNPPEVRLRLVEEANAVCLEICDNGSGIPKEEQGRVFDKFYRVSTKQSRQLGGFGLGLSYSQQVVKLHGGSLSLLTSTADGTTFKIRLPK